MSDNEIKLSSETIATLKKLSVINQSLKIVEGDTTLRSISETKTVAAYAQIKEEFPRDFCVYDLKEFIGVLSVVNDPILDLSNEKYVVIKSEDGKQKLRYIDANPELIGSYFEKQFTLPSEEVTVTISEKDLKAVMDAASMLKLAYIGFKGDGETIYFSAFDKNTGDENETNTFAIEVGETDLTFNAFYEADKLHILQSEAEFVLSKSKVSRIRADLEYWVALESKSKFE